MSTTTETQQKNNPSFVLHKPHEVSFEERPIPEIQDPHDVIIEIKYTGICGSDVHFWHEGRIADFVVEKPMTLGHESAGIVHKAGPGVKSLKSGDKVAIEPGTPCRRCSACKHGKYNLCPDMSFAATPPVDGTLCRYYLVPEDFCYKLPDHISLQEGALVEPTSVAVHATKLADIRPGQSVVVFGAGPVGLLCMAVARAFGANKVVAVDINEDRVKFAKDFAATTSFKPEKGESPQDGAKRMIQECELGGGADVAIDASGAEVCMQQAIYCVRMGGTFVQVGMGKPDANLPIMAIAGKELTIKGSFRYGAGDWALAVELVSLGKIRAKDLISKQVKFEDAEEAFNDTKAGKCIKILIEGPTA